MLSTLTLPPLSERLRCNNSCDMPDTAYWLKLIGCSTQSWFEIAQRYGGKNRSCKNGFSENTGLSINKSNNYDQIWKMQRNKQNCGHCLVNILRVHYTVLNNRNNYAATLHNIYGWNFTTGNNFFGQPFQWVII